MESSMQTLKRVAKHLNETQLFGCSSVVDREIKRPPDSKRAMASKRNMDLEEWKWTKSQCEIDAANSTDYSKAIKSKTFSIARLRSSQCRICITDHLPRTIQIWTAQYKRIAFQAGFLLNWLCSHIVIHNLWTSPATECQRRSDSNQFNQFKSTTFEGNQHLSIVYLCASPFSSTAVQLTSWYC